MKRLPALLLLAFVIPAFADDKPKKVDADIILPPAPQPTPPPAPNPAVPAQLGSDALYIVRAQVDCVVIASPSGILKVTKDNGPLKVRAKLYGGDGTTQTVTYTEKYIYSVETLAKGTAELLIIPPNAGEKDIVRRQIQALDGPQPPPVPPGPPITISISPTTASVPINSKQQFKATVSQGDMKWQASGAGVVDQSGLFVGGAAAGSASIVIASILDPSKTATATVTVTDAPPVPIPVDGFRVLIVFKTAELATMSPAQEAILFDKGVRDYLDAKCVLGPDGKTKEYRIWDASVDASAEEKLWQDAMKLDRKSTPWIVVSDGKTGFSGPLPANAADTLVLLKKYGG